MKTRASLFFVILPVVGFLSPACPVAAKEAPAKVFAVTVVERNGALLFERGAPEFTVRRLLGEPRLKLDRDHWMYARFSALPDRLETDDCETLLLVFSEGVLADIKLINDPAEKLLAAKLRPKGTERNVAAAK